MSLIPVLSVIMIITISLIVTKVATSMLVNTGLSRYSARFQARSAFTGVGFTTSEAEQITTHPSRRRIISSLMLLGNAGIVTVMASLLLTFVHKDTSGLPWYASLGILVLSILLLWGLASSNRVDAWLNRVVNLVLRRYSHFSLREYSSLYKLADDFHLADLFIQPAGPLVGKQLSDPVFSENGVIVLGIQRPNGEYIGNPAADLRIEATDMLIVYGREQAIKEIEQTKQGMSDQH